MRRRDYWPTMLPALQTMRAWLVGTLPIETLSSPYLPRLPARAAGSSPPDHPILVHLVTINDSWFIVAIRLRRRRRWAECNPSLVVRHRSLQLRSKHRLARRPLARC